MVIEKELESLGIKDKEAKIYLHLLEKGQLKASEIYEGTKIQRTLIYELINSLIEKGLVSYIIKSGIKVFEASKPQKLKSILDEKQEKLSEIMPLLKSLEKPKTEKPSVEFYEGKEGLKTILENILKIKKGGTIYAYANNDLFEKLNFYFPSFVKRRIKSKINIRVIQERKPHLITAQKKDKKELREMRFSKKPFKSTVFIWEDKTAFLSLKESNLIGTLIKDKTTSDTQKLVFDILWENSKR